MVTSIHPLKLIPYSRAFWGGKAGLFPASYSSSCNKIWVLEFEYISILLFPLKTLIGSFIFCLICRSQGLYDFCSLGLLLVFFLISLLSKLNSLCLQEHPGSSSHVHSPPIPCSLWSDQEHRHQWSEVSRKFPVYHWLSCENSLNAFAGHWAEMFFVFAFGNCAIDFLASLHSVSHHHRILGLEE